MGTIGGSLAGGVVLLVYAATIGLCAIAWPRGGRVWPTIALVLAMLAIDKALHLESLLVNRLEHIAQAGRWYGARQGIQIEAIVLLASAGVILAGALCWFLRRLPVATRIAACATASLGIFVAIRAVSLHQLDRLFASGVGPVRISNVVELVALCIIGAAAWTMRRVHLRGG